MKYVIGCLAGVGLLVILVLGGCFGLIGFGLFHAIHKPAYAEKDVIEKDYGDDLAKIRTVLSSSAPDFSKADLSADIIAVYDEHKDLLGSYKGEVARSFEQHCVIVNGSGTGSLGKDGVLTKAIIYEMTAHEKTYQVFIVDKHHGEP